MLSNRDNSPIDVPSSGDLQHFENQLRSLSPKSVSYILESKPSVDQLASRFEGERVETSVTNKSFTMASVSFAWTLGVAAGILAMLSIQYFFIGDKDDIAGASRLHSTMSPKPLLKKIDPFKNDSNLPSHGRPTVAKWRRDQNQEIDGSSLILFVPSSMTDTDTISSHALPSTMIDRDALPAPEQSDDVRIQNELNSFSQRRMLNELINESIFIRISL